MFFGVLITTLVYVPILAAHERIEGRCSARWRCP